jgi:4-amino-4-deoxy-L-arabinose transferase-like glycosyltransferase
MAILLLAAVLRIAWAIAVPVDPVSDCAIYDQFARSIVAGHGYGFGPGDLNAFWSPGVAFALAGFYAVFGEGGLAVVLLNLLVALGSIALVWDLGRRWFSPLAGTTAATLLALWPSQIQFTTVPASEWLFNMLVLLAVWIWTLADGSLRRSLAFAAIAGVVLAAATFTRPLALLLPPLLLAERLVRTGQWTRSMAMAAIAMTLTIGLLIPWGARNQREFGQFVLVSANSGANLWMGNNPDSKGGYMDRPERPEGFNQVQWDKELQRQSVAFIRANPGRFLSLCARRLVILHDRETIGVVWNGPALETRYGPRILGPLKAASSLYWYIALAGGAVGAIVLLRRARWRAIVAPPVLLLWGYFIGVHVVIVGMDRYHIPAIPWIALAAGVAFAAWRGKLQSAGAGLEAMR